MSRYRKLDPRLWNDERVRRLTDPGKLAFLFVLTHPAMTALGAMRATMAGLAAELGWSEKRFRDALRPAIVDGMVEVNEGAAYLGLPKFLRYNEPNGPHAVTKAWVDALDWIPECPEKARLITRCRVYLDAKSDSFKAALPAGIWDAFPDAIADAISDGTSDDRAMPCPIHEQEQEQDLPLPPRGGRAYGRQGTESTDARAWIELLNREARRQFRFGDDNLRPIRARIKDGFTLVDAEVVVRHRVALWRGTERDEFLRPPTLYGSKFDSYLQAARAASAARNGHGSDPLERQPIYGDTDFDAQGNPKPEAEARERERLATLASPKD